MFFKRAAEKHALAIAMTSVKLGDRLLIVGCTDASLLAAIGAVVGLSGRVCALVSTDEEAARARKGAERAGILLELEKNQPGVFPYGEQSFNLIVVDGQQGLIADARPEVRVATLQHARRLLAPRGRLVMIERAPRAGLGALLSRAGTATDPA